MPPRPASRLRHPPKRHFWWTATSPSREPSGKGVVFPEGPALFRGTFHASARFPGRSCVFQGDLPCQGPFSRKVLCFSGGPSMLGAIFPEGGCRFGWTFRDRGGFSGRSANGLANGTANGSAKRTALWPGSLFDDLAWQHRQKKSIWQYGIGKKNTIRQGDIGRKFVIPVEIDYFCIVSI